MLESISDAIIRVFTYDLTSSAVSRSSSRLSYAAFQRVWDTERVGGCCPSDSGSGGSLARGSTGRTGDRTYDAVANASPSLAPPVIARTAVASALDGSGSVHGLAASSDGVFVLWLSRGPEDRAATGDVSSKHVDSGAPS